MPSNLSRGNCCVVGCNSTYRNTENVIFYTFPGRSWEKELRKRWIHAVRRKNCDGTPWQPGKRTRICSQHFQGGRKKNNPQSPSYIPTIFPEKYKKIVPQSNQNIQRFERAIRRTTATTSRGAENRKKVYLANGGNVASPPAAPALDPAAVDNEAHHQPPPPHDRGENASSPTSDRNSSQISPGNLPRTKDAASQTALQIPPNSDIEVIIKYKVTAVAGTNESNSREGEGDGRKKHCKCKCEDHNPTPILSHGFHGRQSITRDAEMNDIAGVTIKKFELLLSMLPEPLKDKKISKSNRLLIFLLKMRHGLSYTAIGVFFKTHRTTISKIFKLILFQLYDATARPSAFIPWLSKSTIISLLPPAFLENHSNCRIIIDCSEIRVEMPSEVDKRVYLFSHYKNTFTMKFLIGIAPHGTITFLSPMYGGRSSDSGITVESELLDLLEPGDEVLADKGFPGIVSSLAENHVVTVMPPFNHEGGFTAEEVDTCYDISSVRIHVERAIGRVKTYTILRFVPHNLYKYIDKIMHMACVLTNLQPPLIRNKSAENQEEEEEEEEGEMEVG